MYSTGERFAKKNFGAEYFLTFKGVCHEIF